MQRFFFSMITYSAGQVSHISHRTKEFTSTLGNLSMCTKCLPQGGLDEMCPKLWETLFAQIRLTKWKVISWSSSFTEVRLCIDSWVCHHLGCVLSWLQRLLRTQRSTPESPSWASISHFNTCICFFMWKYHEQRS